MIKWEKLLRNKWFNVALWVLLVTASTTLVGAAVDLISEGNRVGPTQNINLVGGPQISGVGLDRSLNFYAGRFAVDSGTTDSYVITLNPVPRAYEQGMHIIFKAATANTGSCDLNVNSLGEVNIKMLHNQTPADNYIEVGSLVEVVYEDTGTDVWQLLSPDANP